MAYTATQHAAQNRVLEQIRWSSVTGLCPVCRQQTSGIWPDGVSRITCGSESCFSRWLNSRPAPPRQAQPSTGTLPVTIVTTESHA